MNLSNIIEATKKAEDIMTAKYGNSWFIVHSSENDEDQIKIKPEYINEYDDYYNKFLSIWS